MNLKSRFTEEDLGRIKQAVRQAESGISGEIVPVIVENSSYYTIASYRGSVLMAALTMLLIVIFDRYVPSMTISDPVMILLVVVAGGLIGFVLPNLFDGIRRLLITQQHMDQATRQRAENAFLEEEVFNTRHRSGIMIFISFFEHEVIVMADRGISKVVEQKEWDRMVLALTENVRLGKSIEGLESAITRCSEVLLEKGFVRTPDDVNELRDDLRIS